MALGKQASGPWILCSFSLSDFWKKKGVGGKLMSGRMLELCFCLWRWWGKGVSCPFCTPSSQRIGRGMRKGHTNDDGGDELRFRNFFVCVARWKHSIDSFPLLSIYYSLVLIYWAIWIFSSHTSCLLGKKFQGLHTTGPSRRQTH